MTALDWLIVAFALLAALTGGAQGFVVGAAALAGFCGGAFLGGRLGAALVDQGSSSPYAPLFGLVGALVGGSSWAACWRARRGGCARGCGCPASAVVDGAAGAVLAVAVALGLVWLVGAVALQTPGARTLRTDIQRSPSCGR